MALVRFPVEVDITCVNKTWFTLHKNKQIKEDHYVIGFCQRQGNTIIAVLENNSQAAIKQAVLENVGKGAILYAEEKILCNSLREFYEISELKDGSRVDGDVHVNNVKNLWKDLKRVVKQTHIHVSKKHLELYCGEVAWRANHRHLSDSEKFELALSQIATGNKRTYKDLIK